MENNASSAQMPYFKPFYPFICLFTHTHTHTQSTIVLPAGPNTDTQIMGALQDYSYFECAGAVSLTKRASQHPNCITWRILVPDLLYFQSREDAGGSLLSLTAWRACGRCPWLTQLEPCQGQMPRGCLLSSLHWERNRETPHCGNILQQTAQSAGKI